MDVDAIMGISNCRLAYVAIPTKYSSCWTGGDCTNAHRSLLTHTKHN